MDRWAAASLLHAAPSACALRLRAIRSVVYGVWGAMEQKVHLSPVPVLKPACCLDSSIKRPFYETALTSTRKGRKHPKSGSINSFRQSEFANQSRRRVKRTLIRAYVGFRFHCSPNPFICFCRCSSNDLCEAKSSEYTSRKWPSGARRILSRSGMAWHTQSCGQRSFPTWAQWRPRCSIATGNGIHTTLTRSAHLIMNTCSQKARMRRWANCVLCCRINAARTPFSWWNT